MIERFSKPLLPLLLPVLLWTAAAGQDSTGPPAAGQPPAVRELRPELYYLDDGAGRLVPVPGFRYRDFIELFRIKEGLGGAALPPPAILESIQLTIDARRLTAADVACPATVECRVRQTRAGWAMLPLALKQMLLAGPPAHDGPGRILLDADPAGSGFRCWFEPPADAGNDVQHTVSLAGRIPVERTGLQESFAVDLPAAVASRVEIRSSRQRPRVSLVPAAAGEIQVEPATAAAEPAAAGSRVIIAGLAGEVRIRLGEPASGLADDAVAEAACDSMVRIDGRTAQITARLSLANLPAGKQRWPIRLPARFSLRRLAGDGAVVEESLTGEDDPVGGGRQDAETIIVAVDPGSDGTARLELECERPVDASGGRPLDPLGFAVVGIEPWRQRGRLSLSVEGDLQASWEDRPGIRRVDLPAGERDPGLVAAFAYEAQPASLPLRIRPRRSRVVIEPDYRYHVSAARVTLAARLRVAARGAAVGSITLGLDPSWTVGDVGPAGIVDPAAVGIDGEQITIPFAQPLAGEAVVEIEATRAVEPTADSVSWSLPLPRADLVGPASVIIASDSDIELVPDAEASPGLVRQTASAVPADDSDRIPLVYRLDAAEGRFTAVRRFLPRRVEAVTTAEVAVSEREMVVVETIRLDVLHLPLEVLELDLPAEITASGTLEIRRDERLLDGVEIDARDGDEGPIVRVQAVLPEPLLGQGELTVAYRLAMPEIPPESTAAVDLPLPLPVAADTVRQTVVIAEPARLAVAPRSESWRAEVSGRGDDVRSWSTTAARQMMPLAVSARGRETAGGTVVEAAWLRTRLFPDRREDTATFVVMSAATELELRLPGGIAAGAIDVRVDGERSIPRVRGDGLVAIGLSQGGRRQLIEVRTVAPWGGRVAGLGLPTPLVLAPPTFAAEVVQRRFAWEIALLPDDHLLGVPLSWTSQQAWAWESLGWRREAAVSSAELAAWMAETLARGDVAVPAGDWPVLQRRSVYAGIGSPGQATVWVVPTWCLVLAASGITLATGLLVMSTSAWRRPRLVLGVAAAIAVAAAAAPHLMPLAAQAAVPGGLLAGLAAFLRWLNTPASPGAERPGGDVSPSSLTRTAAPTVSLIVASQADTGSTAAVGRDAS